MKPRVTAYSYRHSITNIIYVTMYRYLWVERNESGCFSAAKINNRRIRAQWTSNNNNHNLLNQMAVIHFQWLQTFKNRLSQFMR